jgi:hypothetical protein
VLIGSDDFLFFLDILVDTTQRMCGLGAWDLVGKLDEPYVK